MSLSSGPMGSASEVNLAEVQQEYGPILGSTETIEKAYRLTGEMFLFTNSRLILVGKLGLTGQKVQYHSIPYRAISHFSIEADGSFDPDARLKIWVSGNPIPIEQKFDKSLNVYQLQSVLAEYALK